MQGIQHRTLTVNGIAMHVAGTWRRRGTAPWSSSTASPSSGTPGATRSSASPHGDTAPSAPDLRGYGDTDAPASAASYTVFHLVGDLVALIDALGQDQVFVVGHDWGANLAWHLCMFRPDRVKALVNLSVPWRPRDPTRKPVQTLRALFGEDYYICRFQPGAAEAEFYQIDTRLLIKKFLTYFNPDTAIVPKGQGFGSSASVESPLPYWLSEEDIFYYASKFEKSGFTGGLNYYRIMDLNWELTAPWTGIQIKVPVKFVVGDLDLTYNIPGVQDYIHKGGFKKDVPFLEEVVVMEGVGHFINQEKAHEVTDHICDFIKKF